MNALSYVSGLRKQSIRNKAKLDGEAVQNGVDIAVATAGGLPMNYRDLTV
jgi:hypothetical protein